MSTSSFLPFNIPSNLVFVVDHAPGHSLPTPKRQGTRRRSSQCSTSGGGDEIMLDCSMGSAAAGSIDGSMRSTTSDPSTIQLATVEHREGWIRRIEGSPEPSGKGSPRLQRKLRRRNTPPSPPVQGNRTAGGREQKHKKRASLVRAVSHMPAAVSIQKSGLTF